MTPDDPHAAIDHRPDIDGPHQLDEFGYQQELARTISLTDVVIYGLIYMVPMAPVAVFGIVYNLSAGAAVAVYALAALVMFFSALSYKEMALRFPIAGSVYSYVRLGSSKFLGFIAGWAILLDYLLLPALLCVFAALAMTGVLPGVPGWAWVVIFVIATALINIMGIGVTATMNKIFLVIQLVVLGTFLIWAMVAVAHGQATVEWANLAPAAGGSWTLVLTAIPVAALSFIGFDAISTLNEEAEGGGQTVSKATMIVLWVVAALFVLQVYVATIFVPVGTVFAEGDDTNNAYYDIVGLVTTPWFKTVFLLTAALIALFANAIASNATSSRLVFSMARDGQLPKFLAKVSKTHRVPANSMIFIAVLSLGVGILGVEQAGLLTTLVTFGALTAYILLNISVINYFGIRNKSRHYFLHWISPALSTIILLAALWSANDNAKIVGGTWVVIGIVLGLYFKLSGRSLERSEA